MKNSCRWGKWPQSNATYGRRKYYKGVQILTSVSILVFIFDLLYLIFLLICLWRILVDEVNDHGVTPLMAAAGSGNTDIVHALLNRGADPNKPTPQGKTVWKGADVGAILPHFYFPFSFLISRFSLSIIFCFHFSGIFYIISRFFDIIFDYFTLKLHNIIT